MTRPSSRLVSALALVSTLVLLGAGCSVSLKSKPADGGVFRSANQGATWNQMVFVSQVEGKVTTIGGLGISELQFSPLDSTTLYATAAEGRLYVSTNKGEQWTRIFDGEVRSFQPHPTEREVLYLTSGNRVLRTTDGGKVWTTAYLEGTASVTVNSLSLNWQDPKMLYAGTSRGLLLRSTDAGLTWRLHYTFEKQNIRRVVVNPHDGKVIYVVTASGALWRSGDSGQTWVDLGKRLSEQLELQPGGLREMVVLPQRPDALLIATAYGLFRSFNSGATWENIKLVTAPGAVIISALGVHPTNEQVMYYSADGAFYRTTDGGKTWQTILLPAAHPATTLGVEPKTGAMLYLGFGH